MNTNTASGASISFIDHDAGIQQALHRQKAKKQRPINSKGKYLHHHYHHHHHLHHYIHRHKKNTAVNKNSKAKLKDRDAFQWLLLHNLQNLK